MKIFLAGASGVIGKCLIPRLVQAGYEVVGMTRKEENKQALEQMGIQTLILDAFDRQGMIDAVQKIKPHIVIHQLTDLSQYNLANNAKIRHIGTKNLVDAARLTGVKRIIAQSISWAYEPGNQPASEQEPLDIHAPEPRKTTVDAVAALEKKVSELPEYVILRYGMLYGPKTWYDRDGLIAKQVQKQEVIASDSIRSFVHIDDAAYATFLALQWPTGIFNIVDDEPAPSKEWLPIYAKALNAPTPKMQNGCDRGERGADNTKAKELCKWQPKYASWRKGFFELKKI